MSIVIHFMRDLFSQKPAIWLWVNWLVVVNLASLAFWSEPVAQTIFWVFMLSAVAMLALHARFGYNRIMGTGHSLWLFLVPWLVFQLPQSEGLFQSYLAVAIVTLSISLVFDIRDLWLYLKGQEG